MLDYPACTIPCPGMHSASCRSRHSSSEGERLQLSGGLFKKKIRWLRAGNCIVPKKKDYFSYILKKKILLPERGGSAQERFFFRGAAALASEEEHMEFVPCGLCAGPFVFCFRTVGQRGVQTPDNGYEFFSFSSATRESRGVRGVRLVRFSTGHGQYRTCTVVRVRGPS